MKKIIEDFEKRYGKEPENTVFCGLPVLFARRPGLALGTGLSIGAYILFSKRDDERIQVQFKNSNKMLSVCSGDLPKHRGGGICDILLAMERHGASLGGADILIYENTDLDFPLELLLVCAGEKFCKNKPAAVEMIKHFASYEENFISLSSKKDRLTAICDSKPEYLPFRNQKFKIVISHIDESLTEKEYAPSGNVDDMKNALMCEDVEQFGRLLNIGTDNFLKKHRAKRTRALFETATDCADSLGNGLFRQGGIFSVVENEKVDTFIQNLGSVYEKHLGGRPDFYVTRPECAKTDLPQ